MPHYFRNLCKMLKHYNFVILNDFSNVITKSLNQLFFFFFSTIQKKVLESKWAMHKRSRCPSWEKLPKQPPHDCNGG